MHGVQAWTGNWREYAGVNLFERHRSLALQHINRHARRDALAAELCAGRRRCDPCRSVDAGRAEIGFSKYSRSTPERADPAVDPGRAERDQIQHGSDCQSMLTKASLGSYLTIRQGSDLAELL